jgi:hypothetical protein
MPTSSNARVVVTCTVAAVAVVAVSCTTGSNGGVEFSRSPAANGDDGIPDSPTPAEPVPPASPSDAPSPIPPTTAPTPSGGGHEGFFFSAPGTYQVEADRLVFGAGKFLATSPKMWLGATSPAQFPKGSFLATSTGAFLSKGGTWTNASSRRLKDDLRPVDGALVLRALTRLPVSTWHYRPEAPDVRHLGPMAEDFFRAFHLGTDPRHIATVDSEGVALVALRALAAQSAHQHRVIASLRGQLGALAARVRHLEHAGRGRH